MVVVGVQVNWHFQLDWLFVFGVFIFIYLNVVLCCIFIVLRCAWCAICKCLVVFENSYVGVCIQITFFWFHVVCCFDIHGLPFEILRNNHFMLAFIYGILDINTCVYFNVASYVTFQKRWRTFLHIYI
jgi:hypothetical protein